MNKTDYHSVTHFAHRFLPKSILRLCSTTGRWELQVACHSITVSLHHMRCSTHSTGTSRSRRTSSSLRYLQQGIGCRRVEQYSKVSFCLSLLQCGVGAMKSDQSNKVTNCPVYPWPEKWSKNRNRQLIAMTTFQIYTFD